MITAPHPIALAAIGDGAFALKLATFLRADDSAWKVPAYRFDMITQGQRAGTASLRVGQKERVLLYAGHAGYEVEPQWRGRGFAARAMRLLYPLARAHYLDPLWITCTPDNIASRRTLDRLGAVYVETVALPPDYHSYARGEREKCRYRLDLTTAAA